MRWPAASGLGETASIWARTTSAPVVSLAVGVWALAEVSSGASARGTPLHSHLLHGTPPTKQTPRDGGRFTLQRVLSNRSKIYEAVSSM